MERQSKVYVAGHTGLVGSSLVRRLRADGFRRLVLKTRRELDLTRQADVEAFFSHERPDYVFLAAARVGGIGANRRSPANFLRENLLIGQNVIDSAYRSGAKKLLYLGSSCIYPKLAEQPIREDQLLTGPLEPTNEAYAIAKIAGLKTVQAYRRQHGFPGICLMPTNLYGPGDNFDLETAHVVPALLRKFHEAKVSGASDMVVWGSGEPRREFLYVDDLADAALFLMERYDEADIVNVGCGQDLTIRELAETIRRIVGFEGRIVYDRSFPDGTPRKLLDISRLRALGWEPRVSFEEGLENLYQWFLRHGPAAPPPADRLQYNTSR